MKLIRLKFRYLQMNYNLYYVKYKIEYINKKTSIIVNSIIANPIAAPYLFFKLHQ